VFDIDPKNDEYESGDRISHISRGSWKNTEAFSEFLGAGVSIVR
jgi:hypothetical protein